VCRCIAAAAAFAAAMTLFAVALAFAAVVQALLVS